jgi:hypothetical protein
VDNGHIRAGQDAAAGRLADPLPVSRRTYWAGILVGYLAAVLTSVGVLLVFLRHGW